MYLEIFPQAFCFSMCISSSMKQKTSFVGSPLSFSLIWLSIKYICIVVKLRSTTKYIIVYIRHLTGIAVAPWFSYLVLKSTTSLNMWPLAFCLQIEQSGLLFSFKLYGMS